jgi:Uma2 family endonuclease
MNIMEEKGDNLVTVEELFEMELEEGFFYELLNGHIVKKNVPDQVHQKTVSNFNWFLNNFVREKDLGKIYISPIDVFFDTYNNAQPDILFIKKDRLFIVKDDGIHGQPDLIVEVLSPSSYRNDKLIKMKTYCEFGVAEYWIIDPIYKAIEVYYLENNVYSMLYSTFKRGKIASKVLKGFKIDTKLIFI